MRVTGLVCNFDNEMTLKKVSSYYPCNHIFMTSLHYQRDKSKNCCVCTFLLENALLFFALIATHLFSRISFAQGEILRRSLDMIRGCQKQSEQLWAMSYKPYINHSWFFCQECKEKPDIFYTWLSLCCFNQNNLLSDTFIHMKLSKLSSSSSVVSWNLHFYSAVFMIVILVSQLVGHINGEW